MGTLQNQPPREDKLTDGRIINLGMNILNISNQLGISFDEALNLYLAAAKINDYDAKDEQLAGYAELIQDLINSINELHSGIIR